MTIDTFSGLKAEIAAWLHRDNLTTRIPGFIALAETDIGRELRTWRMESLETLDATTSSRIVPLPTRCRDVKWLKLSGTDEREIKYLPAPAFFDLYGQDGQATEQTGDPRHFTLQENNLLVGPTPSEDYTLTALCIVAPVALSDTNPTNTILTNYGDLYLFGALKHGFKYLRNRESEAAYKADFANAVAAANKESRKRNMAGTPDGIRSIGRRKVP